MSGSDVSAAGDVVTDASVPSTASAVAAAADANAVALEDIAFIAFVIRYFRSSPSLCSSIATVVALTKQDYSSVSCRLIIVIVIYQSRAQPISLEPISARSQAIAKNLWVGLCSAEMHISRGGSREITGSLARSRDHDRGIQASSSRSLLSLARWTRC